MALCRGSLDAAESQLVLVDYQDKLMPVIHEGPQALANAIKLAKMAQIIPGVAVYSLTAFIFVIAAASAAIDPHEIWERWEGPR